MDAKQQVIDYLKHDRTLLGGRNLYNQLPGKSLVTQRTISRFTNTPQNIEKLAYHLAAAVGLPDRNRIILMQVPVATKTAAPVVEETTQDLSPEDKLLAFTKENTDYPAAKALVKALGLKPENKKKATVYAALEAAREALVKKK